MPILNESEEESSEKEVEAPPSPSLGQRLKALVWRTKSNDEKDNSDGEQIPGG